MSAYSAEELKAVWLSAVDTSFSTPYIQAGVGGGFEVYYQTFKQFELISQAIERNFEAFFIMPYSGQTMEPASGGKKATVYLNFERLNDINIPLVLDTNIVVEEVANDYGLEGVQLVRTGRKYRLTETLVFAPGDRGPLEVTALSEKEGYGYNYPYPETIRGIIQPGSDFENEEGTIELIPGSPQAVLIAANASDVPIPEHIGQTIEFISGSNTGVIARILSYEGPNLETVPPHGGKCVLESIIVIEATNTGTFIPGETVYQEATDSQGIFLKVSGNAPSGHYAYVISQTKGRFQLGSGYSIIGNSSGAVIDCDNVLDTEIAISYETIFTAESNTASWRIRSWNNDWALTSKNPEKPFGGKAAILDLIGKGRGIYRVNGESDNSYRTRIWTCADVITPNAVKRAVNRIAKPLGLDVVLREPPGSESLPGFYYDYDAYDYPENLEGYEYRFLFDTVEFRAMILLEVPQTGYDEFGFAFDSDDNGYYDSSGNIFFDGYPIGNVSVLSQFYSAIDKTHAGGVTFDLVEKTQ